MGENTIPLQGRDGIAEQWSRNQIRTAKLNRRDAMERREETSEKSSQLANNWHHCSAEKRAQMSRTRPSVVLFILLLVASSTSASTNLSTWVFPGPSGRLLYQPDSLGNRIVDASGVGYNGGIVPLPASNTVPVKATVSPVGGDNTVNIQNAINQVSALP